MDARFLGGWVYPRARESNSLPLTKITIRPSITQLVSTLYFKTEEYWLE